MVVPALTKLYVGKPDLFNGIASLSGLIWSQISADSASQRMLLIQSSHVSVLVRMIDVLLICFAEESMLTVMMEAND